MNIHINSNHIPHFNNLVLQTGSLLTTNHSLQSSSIAPGEGKTQHSGHEEDDYQLASVIQKGTMIH